MNVTGLAEYLTTDTFQIGAALGVALTSALLLIRYEYLRRVTGRAASQTGVFAAVMTILFAGLVVSRVLGFLAL